MTGLNVLRPRAHGGVILVLGVAMLFVPAGQSPAARGTHTVTITQGPQGTVTSTDASFSYEASQRSTFTCSLDGGGAVPCGSGNTGTKGYSGLAAGAHTFLVIATVSSRDVAQARRGWTVAPLPPQTNRPPSASFTYSPPAPKAGENVAFTSTSSDPDGAITNNEWDLDGDNIFGEASEPAGPTATAASRSFSSAGSYTVRLRVTDNAGAQAVVTLVVEVSAPPLPPGPRRVPVTFVKRLVHGPFVLTGDALRRAAGRPSGVGTEDQEIEHEPTETPSPCAQPLCGSLDLREALSTPFSPPAEVHFNCCAGRVDPQIAASSQGYLVVGMHHFVEFHDKAGKLLTFQPHGGGGVEATLPYVVQLCDLFAPMIPAVNAGLPLPTTKKDPFGNLITVQNGYGINCNKKTGGTRPTNWFDRDGNGVITDEDFYWPTSEIYDARVLWDEQHKRFWIAALMKNSNTQWPDAADATKQNWPAAKSMDVAHARRAVLAIAVSRTADPREGWDVYWTDGFPQQAHCKNECQLAGKPAGGASDYFSMGITSKYLVIDGAAGWFQGAPPAHDSLPQTITVVPTFTLQQTNATKVLFIYQNTQPLTKPDGSILRGPEIQPAIQHDPDLIGDKILFATKWVDAGEHNVLLWTLVLEASESTPTLYQQPIPVRPFRALAAGEAAPQRSPSGRAVKKLTVAVDFVNKLVYRNANLYLTFDECGQWTKKSGCVLSALRFVRIHLDGSVKSKGTLTWNLEVAVDRTFGGHNILDPPGKKAWYGFPSVEVNKKGDAAFVYDRSAAWVYPEARYSVYYLKEKDIRPSRVLQKGNSPIKNGAWHHYLGMSIDGFDDTGIWMITGYAKNGGWAYAIGKVFGKTFADLETEAIILKGLAGSAQNGKYRVSIGVANLGDGAAAATRGRLSLTRTNGRRAGTGVLLESISVPRLRSGRRTAVTTTVQVPARARAAGYRYLRVDLDSTKTLREYGEKNNVVYIALP